MAEKKNEDKVQPTIAESKKNKINSKANIKEQEKAKYNQISKGEMLEFRIKRLFFFMGYYTKNNIIIQTSQDEPYDVVTDLDVFGIYIHYDFSQNTIWADCKSGNAQEINRLSWLIGIKELINVDEILFVKRGTKLSTKLFANERNIKIVDLNILSELEKAYGIKHNDWRNPWKPEIQLINSHNFKSISTPDNSIYKRVNKFITTHYWALTDSYSKVKKTITALKDLAQCVQLPLDNDSIVAIKWAIFQLITMLVLAIIEICRDVNCLPKADKKEIVINGLVYGSNSKQKINDILRVTNHIAKTTLIKNNIDEKISLGVPEIKLYPPEYSEALIDLIYRVTEQPIQYYDILRFLDFTLLEYDLYGKEYDQKELDLLFKNCNELTLSSKTILHFICHITKLPREFFILLQTK